MAMRVVERLNNSSDPDSPPSFLHITFADSQPQVQVSTQLRHAWTLKPADNESSHIHTIDPTTLQTRCLKDVGSFVHRGIHERSDEATAQLPKNDGLSVHTEWRDKVYEFWNHVFYDVANYIAMLSDNERKDGVAHFHPPNSEAFGLDYQEHSTKNDNTITKVWPHDVMLIPAHLQPGVKLTLHSVGDRKTTATFLDATTPFDIWYIRRNTTITLSISGNDTDSADTPLSGLAAVMVTGIMCSEAHDPDDPPGRPEQRVLTEKETQEADLQAEVQSSISNVIAMAMADGAFHRRDGASESDAPRLFADPSGT